MITLLDPAIWVERIKTECPIFEGRVLETLDDDGLALDFIGMPAALVYLASDSSEANNMTGITSQKHDYVMVVKTAIRKTTSKNDRLSATDSRLIRACRLELMKALIGWMSDDCLAPVEHSEGELIAKAPLYFWPDKFTTFDYLRQ